jgi:hypothetical protein
MGLGAPSSCSRPVGPAQARDPRRVLPPPIVLSLYLTMVDRHRPYLTLGSRTESIRSPALRRRKKAKSLWRAKCESGRAPLTCTVCGTIKWA